MKSANSTISFIINLTIAILTVVLTMGLFREDGKWNVQRGKKAMRYFTLQSNLLCAAASVCMCIFPEKMWVYYLKIVGTAGVTVTMLTVFLFLARIYGIGPLLKGFDLFMHLLTPLMALASLCIFERRETSLGAAFLGMLPVALYGPLYLYKVVFAPEGKGWEDFYGFNAGGKWKISYVIMHLGSALMCLAFYFVLNL
ncbi:hypothetical protein [Butyrivibrio sp. VCB2006]|uniref:hypothetical protein n=1 Tax=Butyrivibrio sp. VCB2006 TaxID=1280679 RepID=UPI00041425E7|nr:hypothetical protein [Butyrivibrio sp. VCB2006]